MIHKYRIVFIGTPEFALPSLQKLIEANFIDLRLVITQPDKPVGRKKVLTPPPVKLLAQKYNIPVLQPKKISNVKSQISNISPDLVVLVSYGQIIPREILDVPKYGCLNIHPSLLPKYRGASPIQTAILNGDKETGITIMLMDEKIDHGKIISNIKCQMSNVDTCESLSKKLARLGAELLIKTLPDYLSGKIKPKKQDHSKATFTKIFKKEDGHINWQKSAQEIERQIRAFYPWPGSWTIWNNKKIKIIEAEVISIIPHKWGKNSLKPGQVFLIDDKEKAHFILPLGGFLTDFSQVRLSRTPLKGLRNKELSIACGKNALKIKKLQLEGKKEVSGEEFLRGYPKIVGCRLE